MTVKYVVPIIVTLVSGARLLLSPVYNVFSPCLIGANEKNEKSFPTRIDSFRLFLKDLVIVSYVNRAAWAEKEKDTFANSF